MGRALAVFIGFEREAKGIAENRVAVWDVSTRRLMGMVRLPDEEFSETRRAPDRVQRKPAQTARRPWRVRRRKAAAVSRGYRTVRVYDTTGSTGPRTRRKARDVLRRRLPARPSRPHNRP